MQKLTTDWIKENDQLIYEVISGSKAYGLDTERSDTDIRGVFVLPKAMFYGLGYTPQVNNDSNDIVYYEIGRFIELLSDSNPNILEMLGTPSGFVLKRSPLIEKIQPEIFLSKQCERTFGNYAFTQIKKASGLEKKIVNPVEKERKTILDFCYVYAGRSSQPLKTFLSRNNFIQENLGLSSIPHLRDCYALFYSTDSDYSGIIKKETSNDVSLSSIPKGEEPAALLYFNKDAYSVYCKNYKTYWDWVEKRNEERYNNTLSHGKKYDSKNMMHVFRLLFMAKEIATEGKIHVHRKDRDFLLAVKAGKFEYDDLVRQAEFLKDELQTVYNASDLPDEPDKDKINKLLIDIREHYYSN